MNKEQKRAYDAARYIDNRDKFRQRNKEWRDKNKDKMKTYAREWRDKNKEKEKEQHKNHYINNREAYKAKIHTRRARKNNNGGHLSPGIKQKLLTIQRGRCAICRVNIIKKDQHIDHVMPLVLGGSNEDRNIQITCSVCNLRKGSKDPITFMRTIGYLL